MTCYLPPCCNLSSSPIRQPLTASAVSFTLFRYFAIPTSFEVHPLLLVVRLKVSRYFSGSSSRCVLPSSRRLIILDFSSSPQSFLCHSVSSLDAFYFWMIDSYSRKIGNNNRIENAETTSAKKKLRELLLTEQTIRYLCMLSSLSQLQILPSFIFLLLRRHYYLFSEIRSPLDVGRGVERNIISLNATYKINVVALKLPTCSQL